MEKGERILGRKNLEGIGFTGLMPIWQAVGFILLGLQTEVTHGYKNKYDQYKNQ